MNNKLNDREIKLAHELAELYYQMDNDCGHVSNIDKDRLYGIASKNPKIHYEARKLNSIKQSERLLKKRRKNVKR